MTAADDITRLADNIAIYADDSIDASRLGRLAHHWAAELRTLAQQGKAGGVPEARYECRECNDCGHAGINDASQTVGACFSCEWSGPEPVEDKCPGCGDEGCMTAACPKCGARYRFVAELETATPPAHSRAAGRPGLIVDLIA